MDLKQSQELINLVTTQLEEIRKSMPHEELGILNVRIQNLLERVDDLKTETAELRSLIMDSKSGLVFKLNDMVNRYDTMHEKVDVIYGKQEDFLTVKNEYDHVVRFKENFIKLLWIIVGTASAVIIKLVFNIGL